ncbi:MAG: lytic murein transglycosylase [Actinomycetota bacterium]|nr:lytic murein transglycosylase [Actinomycetota bacterium]
MLAASGIAAIPVAQADSCVVTVSVVGGAKLSFTVNVPAGTPLSSISLPVKLPVLGVTESCSSATSGSGSTGTGSTGTTGSTGSGSVSVPTTTSTGTSSGPPSPSGSGKKQHPTTRKTPGSKQPGAKKPGAKKPSGSSPSTGKSKAKSKKPGALRGAGGVPSVGNPTFSFSLPGPAPLGVPNFFIDSFRIPPFLLPIYQAAGIEYDVPWQVLAAINEIETDYGRNLSISSAGAVGWMQFLPSTWKRWGVDANGDGVADPYNPVDAVFAAARYLHAAGASRSVGRAVFAYNHAGWYVQSVLLRAKLIGGMPDQLIGALAGLVQGHFPVAAAARYADDSVERLATRRVKGSNAAIPIGSSPGSQGTSIFARQGAPVIAVNDGKIVKLGHSARLGRFVELQDATGNLYTYAHLGSIPRSYPVPKPVRVTAAQLAAELSTPTHKAGAPSAPASAGTQSAPARTAARAAAQTAGGGKAKGAAVALRSLTTPHPASSSAGGAGVGAAGASTSGGALVKERLFANPARPGSYAAGGSEQLQNAAAQITSFHSYFTDTLHLAKTQYTLQPLRAGAIVVAGTILGRIAAPSPTTASHLYFQIQPAGKSAPQIDPKPILDGWKLLEATAVYRAAGVDPFFGPGAKNPSVGQVLLMSKEQLQARILQDPHVQIYPCGRRDIQAGSIDRRILATIEFLSASGLDPYVSGLECGHNQTASSGTDAAGATGSSVDITKINHIPLLGHQGPGSITDITIRRLLTLQSSMRPNQIISLMTYKGQNNTLALPDHQNRLQVTYTPLYGQNKKLSAQIKTILKPGQWIDLINRISQIPEPTIPTTPSKYAVKTHR